MVTRDHSWSLVVARGHSSVLLDTDPRTPRKSRFDHKIRLSLSSLEHVSLRKSVWTCQFLNKNVHEHWWPAGKGGNRVRRLNV